MILHMLIGFVMNRYIYVSQHFNKLSWLKYKLIVKMRRQIHSKFICHYNETSP